MTVSNTLTIHERWTDLTQLVNQQLDQRLPSESTDDQADCPAQLAEAMRYAVFPGGKRLRPILVLLAAEACGATVESAFPGACAVELIHCYSLVHDDLPAMDDDDLRRGRPTCHKKFGEAGAILAGDALLTYAFEILASHPNQRIAARSCRVLARAAGPLGMVAGQVEDLAAEGMNREDQSALQRLQQIHRFKTGALLRASLSLGAIAAEASEMDQKALEDYGNCIGLLFQITDDLLDSEGSERAVGKRVGKDVGRGKLTYPSVLGEEQSRTIARELHKEACNHLESFGTPAESLRQLAEMILERDR